ncbi:MULTISPECIES: hypothetical protein [unclassified Aureispira]|uniref:hypothetical protein n=1 Tax=unclassified Aureispira TaxID=2649989 RepID=UPI000698DA19|nr:MULTISPECIES: hypothetical protein [unclassified Aureispira]WMX17289.1 hypothetical protein QP953_12990 [Aureispira sp. CCB-E]
MNSQDPNHIVVVPEEKEQLSMADILQIAKEYAIEVLKYSWLIAIFAVLLGKYMRDRKLSTPTTYTATCSFTVNKVATQNQQNIASIFGGAGAAENNVNFKRLQEIIVTRKIISRVLFHKSSLRNEEDTKEDYLINHYLRKFYYKKDADKVADKEDMYFQADTIDPYNRRANYLLMYVHNLIVRNHLIIEPSKGGIMILKVVSTSEDFSYELIMALYKELDRYYSEDALEQKEHFYEMAEKRTEQLREKLNSAEAAYINHANTNTAEADGRNNTLIKTQFLSTDLKKATQSYFAALANKEAAWVSYESQKQTPSMSIVDPPLYPLAKAVPNPSLHMIVGGILGAGLAFLLIVGRKFVKDFLGKQKEEELEAAEKTEESVESV